MGEESEVVNIFILNKKIIPFRKHQPETTVQKLQKKKPENTTELGGNRVPLDNSILDEGRIVNLFIED